MNKGEEGEKGEKQNVLHVSNAPNVFVYNTLRGNRTLNDLSVEHVKNNTNEQMNSSGESGAAALPGLLDCRLAKPRDFRTATPKKRLNCSTAGYTVATLGRQEHWMMQDFR